MLLRVKGDFVSGNRTQKTFFDKLEAKKEMRRLLENVVENGFENPGAVFTEDKGWSADAVEGFIAIHSVSEHRKFSFFEVEEMQFEKEREHEGRQPFLRIVFCDASLKKDTTVQYEFEKETMDKKDCSLSEISIRTKKDYVPMPVLLFDVSANSECSIKDIHIIDKGDEITVKSVAFINMMGGLIDKLGNDPKDNAIISFLQKYDSVSLSMKVSGVFGQSCASCMQFTERMIFREDAENYVKKIVETFIEELAKKVSADSKESLNFKLEILSDTEKTAFDYVEFSIEIMNGSVKMDALDFILAFSNLSSILGVITVETDKDLVMFTEGRVIYKNMEQNPGKD